MLVSTHMKTWMREFHSLKEYLLTHFIGICVYILAVLLHKNICKCIAAACVRQP